MNEILEALDAAKGKAQKKESSKSQVDKKVVDSSPVKVTGTDKETKGEEKEGERL